MGALANPGGWLLLALLVAATALWGLLAVTDRVRELAEQPAPAAWQTPEAKKDPWGCGDITQEPRQDVA